MTTHWIRVVFGCVILGAGFAAPAAMADGFAPHRTFHHHRHDQVGGNGLPSYVRGVGTFAGGISAVRFRGNGIYFYSQNGIASALPEPEAPKVKIISVGENETRAYGATSACAYEHGVCVIRGTR